MSGPWAGEELRHAIEVDVAAGALDAVEAARWLAAHPDGALTAEDFADRPATLPPVVGL